MRPSAHRPIWCAAMRSTLTRRGALGGAAALALASCGGGDPPPSTGPRAGSGAGLLSSIVALEHAADRGLGGDRRGARAATRAATRRPSTSARWPTPSAWRDLVRGLGGTPPKTRPAGDYARLFPRMTTEADALHFARDLEERLVRAYLEGLRLLPDSDQRRATVEIAAEEAEDLAVVHVLAGGPAAPQPFVTGTVTATRRDVLLGGGRGLALAAPALAAEPADADQLERLLGLERRLAAAYEGASRATPSSPRSATCCSATSASTSAGWSRRSDRLGPRATAPAPKTGLDFANRRAFARSALELEERRSIPTRTCSPASTTTDCCSRSARSWPAGPGTRWRCARCSARI